MTDIVEGNDFADFPEVDDKNPPIDEPVLEPNGCDLSGVWFGSLATKSIAATLGATAMTNNFFYIEIDDHGDDFTITRSFDCGFEVCRATTVVLTDEQVYELSRRNRMDGNVDETKGLKVAARTGVYKPSAEGECEFSLERWWSIRGASVEDSLPARGAYSTTTIPDMMAAKPLPPPTASADAVNDWDNDGKPGITLNSVGVLSGWRTVSLRDWNEIQATAVLDGAKDFTVPAQFDSEEVLFDASKDFLRTGATPAVDGHSMRFVRLSDTAPTGSRDAEIAYCRAKITELVREGNVCSQFTKK